MACKEILQPVFKQVGVERLGAGQRNAGDAGFVDVPAMVPVVVRVLRVIMLPAGPDIGRELAFDTVQIESLAVEHVCRR